MPDALEIEISNAFKNIVRRAEDRIIEYLCHWEHYDGIKESIPRISDRKDVQLAFCKTIRETIKRAGYKK